MKNIFIMLIIVQLAMISSCTLPLFPNKALDLHPYLQDKELVGNDTFNIQHLPSGFNAQQILDQATAVWEAMHLWLAVPLPETPVSILIFSPDEPVGKQLLKRSRSSHQTTGHYSHDSRVMVVTGKAGDPRFLTVLRHEATHAALHNAFPAKAGIPFWLDEGIASLFEQGIQVDMTPVANNERLAYIIYLIDKKENLSFSSLISKPFQKITSGKAYARSWGIVSCLYNDNRDVKNYLNRLTKQQISPQNVFRQYLLTSAESIDDFEMNCSRRFLAQQNRPED